MEWYYADETDQQIAFQEDEFKGLIEAGTIKPTTLIWNASMPDWKPASAAQPMLFSSGSVAAPSTTATGPSTAGSQVSVQPSNYHGASPPQSDGMGIASMICGIFAILMTCGYGMGLFPGIAAIICGHISKKRIANSQIPMSAGMTTAGLITGYIGTILSLLFIIGIVIFFVMVGSEAFQEAMESGLESAVEAAEETP